MKRTAAIALLAVHAGVARASTIYIAASAPPGGTGESWASPLNDLQAALALAGPGDELRIAQGEYRPGPIGTPKTVSFLVDAGITLRGGYAGPGTLDPDARDPGLTPTILSGDLGGDDQPNFVNRFDNSYHIVRIPAGAPGGAEPTLDGLTFRGGFANGGWGDRSGGAIFATGSSPAIVGCLFTGNDSDHTGAAISTSGGAATIERCRFIANRVHFGGGGVYASGGSAAAVRDCLFEDNIGGVGAGAMNDGAGTAATFERCTFAGNTGHYGGNSGLGFLDREGAAVLIGCEFTANTTTGGGGAVFCWSSGTTMINCRFVGNSAMSDGGGAFHATGPGHQRLINCLFTGNISPLAFGGAALVRGGAFTEFIHCTIIHNGDPGGGGSCGGVEVAGSARADLYGSILWGNFDPQNDPEEAQVRRIGTGSILNMERCIVQGWTGSLGGAFNGGADPLLADADGPDNIPGTADDDARLLPGSPAIDSADNTRLPASITTDLAGLPRFVDDAAAPNSGIPGGGGGARIADLGCHERQAAACYANCDASASAPVLNIADFTCFLQRFAAGESYANCDLSTAAPVLNVADFTCFLQRFAAGCD